MEKEFYLIDTESDDYFVGRIKRKPDQICPELNALEVGQTFWSVENSRYGWERFK